MAHSRFLGFARNDKKERVVEWEKAVAKGKGSCRRRRQLLGRGLPTLQPVRLTRFVGEDPGLQAADYCFRDQAFDGAA